MPTTAPLGRPFRRLWGASTASNLADGIAQVAWPWLASAVTRDPLALAVMGMLAGLPWLLFSLPVGVIVDRVDRGRLIAVADALRCVIALGVAGAVALFGGRLADPAGLSDEAFVPPANQALWLAGLYAAAFLLGTVEVARDSAAQAFLPRVVRGGDLERANGRLMSTEIVANSLVGPPVGGLLVATALFLPFVVNAGAFAVSALLVLSIGARPPARRAGGAAGVGDAGAAMTTAASGTNGGAGTNGAAGRPGFGRELREGLRWLWRNDLLRHLAIVLGSVNFAATLAMATAVLFAQEVLQVDGARFGLMLTGGAVGGLVGGLLAARIAARIGPGWIINGALATMGAVFLVVSQLSQWPWVWALMALESFTAIVWNVVTVSLRQRIIPTDLFGRVNSVYRFLSWGVIPLGALLGGALVTWIEPVLGREAALRAPFVVGGVLALLLLVPASVWLTNARIAAALPEPD